LDLETTSLFTYSTFTLLSLIFLFATIKQQERNTYIAFSLSYLLAAIGYFLLFQRGIASDLISIILANLLLFLSLYLIIQAYFSFFRSPFPWKIFWSTLTIFLFSFSFYTYIIPSTKIRIIVISVLLIFAHVLLIEKILKNRSNMNVPAFFLNLGPIIIISLTHLYRLYSAIQAPADISLVSPESMIQVTFIILTLTNISQSFGIMQLVAHRFYRSMRANFERAKSESEFIRQLISIIGHDVRNPLVSLKQMISIIEENPERLDAEQFLPELEEIAEKSLALLNNLVAWGKSSTNTMEYKPSATILLHRVQAAAGSLHPLYRQKKVQLIYTVEQSILVHTDDNFLETILRNLLSNSLKFSPSEAAVTVSAQVDGHVVHCMVEDQGPGMTDSQISEVLSEGTTKSTRGTRGERGSGLGFRIINNLCAISGMEIDIISEPGKGTKTILTMAAN
jgi:signal transduction histidine kinase